MEEFPSTGGAQAQITPQCYGYQNALSDNNSAAMIYVDLDLTKWQGPSLARQIQLAAANYQIGSVSVAADPASNIPAIVLSVADSWASPYIQDCEAWYDAGDTGLIASLFYTLEDPSSIDPVWNDEIALSSDDVQTIVETSGNVAATFVANTFTPSTPYRYAAIAHAYGVTPAGTQGATYNAYWRVAVYGNHGLTLRGSSSPMGVWASDVIAHALTHWAAEIAFTTGSNGTIQPSAFVIPQLVFAPTTVANIIQQSTQYELLDWAVWEQTGGTTGPTMFVNERGARGKSWVSRVGPAQLQQAGPQASRIWNGVVVQFTGVDGLTQTAGPPGSGCTLTDASLQDLDPSNPANEAGIDKWAPLQMGTSTPAGAIQVGGKFLVEQAQADTAGSAALVGHIQDTSGVWWPAWMARAGDSISFLDAANSSPRRIVNTSYDDSSKTNSISLDQPPDSIAALLQRMSIDISPLSLS
jgi:LysM repeat protein